MKTHQFDKVEAGIESRLVRIETVIEHITYILDRVDKRFDVAEKQSDKFSAENIKSFKELAHDLEKMGTQLEAKIEKNYRTLMRTVITLFLLNGFVPEISRYLGIIFNK